MSSAAIAEPTDFEEIQALLDVHCIKCHGPEKQKAKIDFSRFPDHESRLAADDLWERVAIQIEDGEMPPDDEEPLNEEQREHILDWYRATFEAVTEPTPGPSPPRRLTRREYQNSLEDLLGIELQQQIGQDGFRYMKPPPTIVEQYFSPDPPGASGFDNDAGVLAFNDTMLVKYLQVAQYAVGQIDSFELSRKIVFGDDATFELAMRPPAADPFPEGGIVQPTSIELLAGNAAYSVLNLINGSGLPDDLELKDLKAAKHDEFNPGTAWTTSPNGGDYFGKGTPPVLLFDLGAETEVTDVAIWGYHNGRFNANEAKALTLEFSSDGKNFDGRLDLTRKLTGADCEILNLGEKRKASHIKITFIDNHRGAEGAPGGDRVGLGEIKFLNLEPPPKPIEIQTAEFKSAEPILRRFATRSFRRPVEEGELARYTAVFEAGGTDFDAAIKDALSAILTSSQFIFRVEAENPDSAAETWKISDHELATRLSYFLWSSTPDLQLRELAESGKLSDPEILRSEVSRMIASPKLREFSRNFAGQWIGFNEILAPEVIGIGGNGGVKRRLAMYEEALLFFEALVRNDDDIFAVIESRDTFLNTQLANIYQERSFKSDKRDRTRGREDAADPLIAWTLTDPNRGGYLTMGATMLMTSAPQRTSPIRRGVWVLDALLGTPVPEPPPMIPLLEETTAAAGRKLTVREQMELHAANDGCMKCHESIDPLGLGLENFGPAGIWRTKAGNQSIDAAGVLPGGRDFSTPAEMREALLADFSDEIRRNVVERMLAYALGRRVRYFDEPVVQQLLERLESNDDRIGELILGVVASEAFQFRGTGGEAVSGLRQPAAALRRP